jgi:hypothetical protein
MVFITLAALVWEAFFTARTKFAHYTQGILHNLALLPQFQVLAIA